MCIQYRAMCGDPSFAVLYFVTKLCYHSVLPYSLRTCKCVYCIMSPYRHCLSSLPQQIWAAL